MAHTFIYAKPFFITPGEFQVNRAGRWGSRPLPDELDDGLVGRARDCRQYERPVGIKFVGTRERLAKELLAGRELDLVEDNYLFGVNAERTGVEHGRVRGIETRDHLSRRPAETVAYLQRASSRFRYSGHGHTPNE